MTPNEMVGRSLPRVDGLEKVAGLTKYGLDMRLPGMLYIKTLRSVYPHAVIKKIDTYKAERALGVVAVFTARDVCGSNRHGEFIQDQWILVPEGDKARMMGDPLALVVARSEEQAQDALELVQVTYEEMEAFSDPESALRPDAPKIHDGGKGNLCGPPWVLEKGDVQKGFEQADLIVEEIFRTPRQAHLFLEPEGGVATVDANGSITVYAGTQAPWYVRSALAEALAIPESKLRIVPTTMGGAFGGKMDVSVHAHLALAASKLGQPVKLVWTFEETMRAGVKRHPVIIRHKIGARADGRFTAMGVDYLMDGGAYASQSPRVLEVLGSYLPGAYDIPHMKLTGRVVYTNNPVSGAFRGFGGAQALFATESQVDVLACRLGLDPREIRLKNAIKKGATPNTPFITLDSEVSLPQTLQKVREVLRPLSPSLYSYKKRGRGWACSISKFDISAYDVNYLKGTGAFMELLPDGSILVRCGATEHGSGVSTVLTQMTAQELTVEPQLVSVILGDTATTPKSGHSVASRQVYCCGNALLKAAKVLKEKIFKVAQNMLEATAPDLQLEKGKVFVRGSPDRSVTLREVGRWAYREGINLSAAGWFSASHALIGHTFTSTVADVEVDEETGEVDVLGLTTAHDSGRAINPLGVTGQLLGGQLQGLGFSLMEEVCAEKGMIINPSFAEYCAPTVMDTPEQAKAIIVEEPYPTGPYGAKGVGEHPIHTIAPSIINAVYDATGVRITSIPAKPEEIKRAISKMRAKGEFEHEKK